VVAQFDVFNGDADGICALHQLRLEEPCAATLVTGVKRDIALLARVDAGAGDRASVLDISLATNRLDVLRLIERGVVIEYFDHHRAGEVPQHPNLRVMIDTSADVCTAILVDRHLQGRYRIWAIVAAYGDNLAASARRLATTLGLDARQCEALRELGDVLAYNAYGDTEADLIVHPAALYDTVHRYADPFELIANEPLCRAIAEQRDADLGLAEGVEPRLILPGALVYVLPDAAWSRRVRGSFGNILANRDPHLAHAILSGDPEQGYMVSVRAPLMRRSGADALCAKFASGGGRAGAAGINHLPQAALAEFARELDCTFPAPVTGTSEARVADDS
ncbi:MAG TPA: acetyltransferase, partial [Casimicrobiaceae bacterium]|nr:acetyltransferase [Casimicrobiaceae bacterium]